MYLVTEKTIQILQAHVYMGVGPGVTLPAPVFLKVVFVHRSERSCLESGLSIIHMLVSKSSEEGCIIQTPVVRVDDCSKEPFDGFIGYFN
jgi:hypothetical protein